MFPVRSSLGHCSGFSKALLLKDWEPLWSILVCFGYIYELSSQKVSVRINLKQRASNRPFFSHCMQVMSAQFLLLFKKGHFHKEVSTLRAFIKGLWANQKYSSVQMLGFPSWSCTRFLDSVTKKNFPWKHSKFFLCCFCLFLLFVSTSEKTYGDWVFLGNPASPQCIYSRYWPYVKQGVFKGQRGCLPPRSFCSVRRQTIIARHGFINPSILWVVPQKMTSQRWWHLTQGL